MGHREEKQQEIDIIRDRFSKATAAVLLDFRGIDVESVTELRAQFRKAGVEYRVVKNKLVKFALKETAFADNVAFQKYLVGPTGIAWSYEDPSSAAKILKAFHKDKDDDKKVNVKCGLVGQDVMPGDRVEKDLASLPGKDELRAMLLATLQAPAQNLVRLLNAPAQNLVYLIDARKRSQESQQ